MGISTGVERFRFADDDLFTGSVVSTSLIFALKRPSTDDEVDLRVAGLEGTEADPGAGDDGDEDIGGSGRVA